MHPPGGGGGGRVPGCFRNDTYALYARFVSPDRTARRRNGRESRPHAPDGGRAAYAVAATGPASVRREELVGDVAECLRRACDRAVDAAGATAGRRPLVPAVGTAAGRLRLREGVDRLREDAALGLGGVGPRTFLCCNVLRGVGAGLLQRRGRLRP